VIVWEGGFMVDVFMIDFKVRKAEDNINARLPKLFNESGLGDIIDKGDIVAVKVHMGEEGNFTHIRPIHVRIIVEEIKKLGGVPFVTDTTGVGLDRPRGTAVGYLRVAASHGFTSETVGAPIIIADGLKGLSGVKVKVNGKVIKEVEIGQAIAEADCLISLAHFKGHPRTGFGGALKNIGMGCVTKSGKAQNHLKMKPYVKSEPCNGCGKCVDFCPVNAIEMVNGKAKIDREKCVWGCGCWAICPEKAISSWGEMHRDPEEFCIAVVETVLAVVNYFGKDKVGYMNFLYDITAHCDCFPFSDNPFVPNIGVLASRDPVAIDKASLDLVNQAPGLPYSVAEELGALEKGSDKFSKITMIEYLNRFPPVDPLATLKYAKEYGLGETEYSLVKI